MHRIKIAIASIVMALGVGLATAVPVAAEGAAGEAREDVCAGIVTGGGTCTDKDKQVSGLVKTIVNVISALAGIVAVIMIIVSGIKYITSGGDSSKIAAAKNTLIFALVGLVIVVLAQVIVRFVLKQVV